MNGVADSAVGAILTIPPELLNDIDKAEKAIKKLALASAEAAGKVNDHWGVVAPHGLQKFIDKIAQAQEAMKRFGGTTAEVKFNTEPATKQMSDFAEKVQSDSSKVSQSLQEIAATPVNFNNVKEEAEVLKMTFKDVQDKIKALRNGLKIQETEGIGAQTQLQTIKAWEDYYKSVSKVNEETGRHNRIVGDLRTKISEVQQAIDHENAVIARFSQKVQDAWAAVNAFKTANPNFNVDKAEQQLESLRGKIQRLYEQLEGGGLSEKKENRITREIEQFKQQYATLDNTIAAARRVWRELSEAEDIYESRANNSTRIISQKASELSNLNASLKKAEQAQASFNAELEKGNTAKSLASEYAKLTKRLQEVNDAMNKFQSAGGNVNTASFQALQTEWQNIMARRKEIEKMDIVEVNQYRQQMAQSAYQADLSAFVQNEAQKKAEAQKTVNEQIAQARQAGQQYAQSFAGAMAQYNQMMSGRAGGNLVMSLENVKRVLNDLKTAAGKLNILNPADEAKAKQLKDAIENLNKVVKQYKQTTTDSKPTVTIADANQARKIAEQTKTLKDYETAYKMLIEVMNQTPQGRSWNIMNAKAKELKTHIDEIKKKTDEFKSKANKLSGIMGQLQGRIAAAFSIGAIGGFLKKVTEVRAQFELQRVALGAIIQDRDEANKIFTQVQNMALESPFSIMQLERATKQIAAFGFEAKKLVPTMKMFADISAGLGVEIDRLVLVMGHLKARNFLEGCLGLGTPVKMVDGSVKRVEDIVQGESIMGDDDTPRIVKQVIRGYEQMYEVSYADGSFRCNEKHILTLYNADKDVIEDVYVLDYLKTPDTYKGVRRANGRFEYFDIVVEKDVVDNYYGFVIDGNRRFQLGDGTVTHNTMVRQFTNMGFNVLGELSKYYSELENRMVSVAEVQDRVKKKMISFEDVEEVLKRVTSAGGMFYDMQKKQSDSIWGQMQRIKDAYDLMLNEIGQSNEGTIKMVLSSIRSLINSWRSLKPYIVAAVAAMSSYMAVAVGWKMISTLITGSRIAIILFTKGLQAAKAAQQSLNITMSANPYAAVAAAVVALGTYLYQVATATSKLEEEMERIGSDLTDSLNESIATFKQLADTISDSNSTYTERTEAMTELRRVYADILPQEKMEIAYIQSLHGNYAELTKDIQKYYQEKEYNQKMEVIQGSNEAKALQTQWEETLTEMNERGLFDLKYSRAQIKSWAETLSKEMTSGKLNASVESLDKRIKDIFNAKDLSKYWKDVGGTADIQDILQAYQKLEDVQGSIYLNTLNAENAFASYSEQIKHLDVSGLESLSKGLNEQREEVEKKIQDFKNEKYVYIEELGRAANIRYEPDAIDYLNEQLKQTETQLKAVQEAEEQWLANQFKEEVSKLNNELTAQYKAYWDLSREMESLRQNGKLTKSEIDRLSTAMKQAEESAENARKKFGLGEEYSISKGFLDSADTSYELQQKLDTLATKAFPKVAEFAMKAMNNLSKAILQGKISVFGFLKDVADALPDFVKESIPGLNGILSKVDERLKLSEQQLAELGNAANEASEKAKNTERSFDEIVSPIMERRVGQFGADLKEIDDILVHSDKTGDGAAKSLRARAKSWDELVKAYNTVPDKDIWLELNHQTKESMEMMEKNSKAAKQLAIDLAGVDPHEKKKKGAKGKDPWQERLSLFKELNTEYEKLLKNYSAEESKQRIQLSYAKAVAEIFKGQGKFGDIKNWLGFDKESMIKVGQQMLDTLKISPEKRKDMEKQLAGLKAEVDVHIQEDAVKDFEKHMQEVADNLELSDVFRKLGVPIDIVYTLGGKPTTLEDQRKELEDNYYEIFKVQKKYGEEGEKAYDKIQQAIAKKEQKNLEERAKNYIKYLTESMGERAQIEINAMRDINKIEEDMTLDNFSKQQAIMQRRKKMQEDLAKFDLGELKGSDVYLSVFKDLENASKEQLQYVINKFKELQSTFKNLSPAQVKSIASEIKKMEDALAGKDSVKNLFANLRDSIKYARQRNNLLREQTKIQDDIDKRSEMLSRAEKYLTELELNRKGIQDESSEEWQEANEKVLAQQEFVKKLQDEIESLRKKLGLVTESISKGEQAWQKWKQGIANIRNGMGQVKDSVDAVFSGLDSMGLVNDAFRDTYESIGEIMGGLDTFMGGLESINIMKPFSIITGSIKAIGGVFQTIGGFFGIGDKKKERSIQRLADKVESLDKAYQKLEESIEGAYTFSDYNAGYKQMQDNLEAQKKSYEEMIALEESKKKTDKDKVKEYNDKLEEIAEKQKELRKERIEAMGSTTDYLNEAQSFVDAWLDAYKETGSGLDALGDKWEEFVENLFVKQGAAQIVSSRLKGIIDTINTAIEAGATDFNLADVVNKAREDWKKEAEIIEPLLEQLFGSYGLGKGNGDFILSDLQKGIQNITEPQAAAIEAYLNSMRFAVFRHTEQLDTLIATIQMQYGSGTENPVVTELKGIRGVLDNIDRRLASVINTQGRNATLRIGT